MKVRLKGAFIKDLRSIPKKKRTAIEKSVFSEFPSAKFITEIKNVKKISGYASYYRVRFGSYRVGFEYKAKTVIFLRVLDRKDIYRYFP